jgi:O-antigen biosynthesis protein
MTSNGWRSKQFGVLDVCRADGEPPSLRWADHATAFCLSAAVDIMSRRSYDDALKFPRPYHRRSRKGPMSPDALFFDEERHCEALALLASARLSAGDAASAFMFADRRCRLLTPGASDFLLRAEASRLAGHFKFAESDLAKAVEIDPTNILVNRSVLTSRIETDQERAAARLIEDEATDHDTLILALEFLRSAGARTAHRLRMRASSLVGWIAWRGFHALDLRIGRVAGSGDFTLEPDADHPLASAAWSAADVEIEDGESTLRSVGLLLNGRVAGSMLVTPKHGLSARRSARLERRPSAEESSPRLVSIVVPVYEDLEATKACLESLLEQRSAVAAKLIVVEDHSPSDALRAYLDAQAAAHKFLLLRNQENLGFAKSVNRALDHCPTGDILLVNADAWLPAGALDRLAAVAYSGNDIGTVTPFSNNGEFTSFPKPNVANPLPSNADIAEIDRRATIANGVTAIDLPNGIGFCLYIKRACLDVVGSFSELYARGYFEDVEFCLKARERGFRNVCAVGVFVGHAGARSFREEKRALVVRNLRIIEARFPDYRLQCAAFLEADPLKPGRGAIEHLAAANNDVVLLASIDGVPRALADLRSRQFGASSVDAPSMHCTCSVDGRAVEFRGVEGRAPQSLAFSLVEASGLRALRDFLGRLSIRRIEVFDARSIPDILLGELLALDSPVDVICGDLQWFRDPALPLEGPCRSPDSKAACDDCMADGSSTLPVRTGQFSARQDRLDAALNKADAIKPLDRMAEAFARCNFREKAVSPDAIVRTRTQPRLSAPSRDVLAFLVPAASGLIDRQIAKICRLFTKWRLATKIVVLGRCVNDLALMGTGNVFVAGEVQSEEYLRLIAQYEVRAIMSPYRTCFFGLLDQVAEEAALPKGYFDWSFGALEVDDGDLSLDPRICDERAALAVADWLRTASHNTSMQ